jgi:hypothetical protein
MRRIYFLLPGAPSATAIVNELLLARVEWRHIHLMAGDGVALEQLPEASIAQKSDIVPALQRGLIFGTAVGFVTGCAVVAYPMDGLRLNAGTVMLFTLAGAGFGAWVASMIGLQLPNSRLERFRKPLAEGQLLLMIDVPAARVQEIEELVHRHHPEAGLQGTEPMIPAFP